MTHDLQMKSFGVLCAVSAFAACSEPKTEFGTKLPTREVMQRVIDPAAVALWGRAGEVQDEKGVVVDLAPTTEEEWAMAENEAAVVAEGGNLLLLPDRVRRLATNDTDWTTFAKRLTEQALAVKEATAARDKDKMFETGGDLYLVCVACHEKYYIPFLKEDDYGKAPRK